MYQSIYETEFAARPRYDALPESRTVDVAIVGGGLTGISAALTLAEAGFAPVVLEAGQIGAGGSGRNGGHVCQGWPNDFFISAGNYRQKMQILPGTLAWRQSIS